MAMPDLQKARPVVSVSRRNYLSAQGIRCCGGEEKGPPPQEQPLFLPTPQHGALWLQPPCLPQHGLSWLLTPWASAFSVPCTAEKPPAQPACSHCLCDQQGQHDTHQPPMKATSDSPDKELLPWVSRRGPGSQITLSSQHLCGMRNGHEKNLQFRASVQQSMLAAL